MLYQSSPYSKIYQIFIDRFAGFPEDVDDSKPTWIGGTLKGVKEKISYLRNIGIDTILLSPLFKGSAYHGYAVTDFSTIDPHFGTYEDLKSLVALCHESGISVMIDFVANHCSCAHPFFQKAQKDATSAYRNWFIFSEWPDTYLSFSNNKDLPKLNLKNAATKKYVIKSACYWIKEFDLDGFRLDHAIGPPTSFWREFCIAVKEEKEEIKLIGEVWFNHSYSEESRDRIDPKSQLWDSQDDAMNNYVDIFDGCLDFSFNTLLREYIVYEKISEHEFWEKLKAHYARFPKDFLLPMFLDNHDMDRFLFSCGNDIKKLFRAIDVQFALPQPKIIYYGTETGLSQKKSVGDFAHNGDLMVRKKMIWNAKKQNKIILNKYRDLLRKKQVEND